MMQLITINTPQGIKELEEYLVDKEYIAYDCETTGLLKTSEIIGFSVCAEDEIAYYVVLSEWRDGALHKLPDTTEPTLELIKSLQGKSLVMHNAIFDCMMAEAFFKIQL